MKRFALNFILRCVIAAVTTYLLFPYLAFFYLIFFTLDSGEVTSEAIFLDQITFGHPAEIFYVLLFTLIATIISFLPILPISKEPLSFLKRILFIFLANVLLVGGFSVLSGVRYIENQREAAIWAEEFVEQYDFSPQERELSTYIKEHKEEWRAKYTECFFLVTPEMQEYQNGEGLGTAGGWAVYHEDHPDAVRYQFCPPDFEGFSS